MLKLQDVKMGLAEAALGEGTGTRLHKMSVKEIKFVSFLDLRIRRLALINFPAVRHGEAQGEAELGSAPRAARGRGRGL